MSFHKDLVLQAIRNFTFEDLFIDGLGWNSARTIQELEVELNNESFIFTPIAEKGGLVVFLYQASEDLPSHSLRKKLDRRVGKIYLEHLIIFINQKKTRQLWQWVLRKIGRPLVFRTHEYRIGQSGESLLQKLERMAISLVDEDDVNSMLYSYSTY